MKKWFLLTACALLPLVVEATTPKLLPQPHYPYKWPPTSSSSSSSSSSRSKKSSKLTRIGNFILVAKTGGGKIGLSNNVFYKPKNHRYKKLMKSWNIKDVIRLFETDHKSTQVLVNLSITDNNKNTAEVHVLKMD